MALKLSKKYLKAQESGGVVPIHHHPLVPISTTIVNTNKIVDTNNTNTSRSQAHDDSANEIDCKTKIQRIIASATNRVIERRQAKASRVDTVAGIPALHDLNAMWKVAMVAKYGTCTVVGVTYKDYGIFKRVAKVHTIHGTWSSFITWAVDNWAYLNQKSKRTKEQMKTRKGEWSLQDDAGIFLGSDMPSIHHFLRCYLKLLSLYGQEKNRVVAKGDSTEVVRLKRELAERTKEVADSQRYAQQMGGYRAGQGIAHVARSAPKPVKQAIDPATDTFFDDTEAFSLPDWK